MTRAPRPKEYEMRLQGPEGNLIALDTRAAVARVSGVCKLNHATLQVAKFNLPLNLPYLTRTLNNQLFTTGIINH